MVNEVRGPELIADDLFTRFESWADDHGVEADLFFVEVALDWCLEQDLDPARWSVAEVRDLLLHWFPRKVTLDRADWPSALSTLHHWIDFLTTTPVGRTGDPGALHAEIDRVAEEYFAAMADERNYGIAKFWTTRMIAHGVDPEDGVQVRDFLDAVNAGEIDYDQSVLDEIMRRQTAGSDESVGPLPPVVLPDDHELEGLADRTVLVKRLRLLTEWVGAGRALTQTKRLRVADARELAGLLEVDQDAARVRSSADLPTVSLLVAWATALRLVRVVKGRLVAVKSAAGLLDRPWDLWQRAFGSFPALGPAACMPSGHYDEPALGYVLPELLPDLFLVLYRAPGTPLPVELLAQFVQETLGVDGFFIDWMWRRDLDGVLTALEMLGAVEVTTTTDPENLDKIAQVSGRGNPDPRLVELTPSGLWGARQVLLAGGAAAPLAADLVALPADRAYEALVHAQPDITEYVLTEWVGARTPADAAAELADFCAQASSPTLRVLAWAGLDRTGDEGVRQARRLREEGGVAGATAAEWLVRRGVLDPGTAREQEMLLAFTDGLAALHERGLLIAELVNLPPEEQIRLVRAVAAGDHPDRTVVLAEISANHPAQDVAAAARQSL